MKTNTLIIITLGTLLFMAAAPSRAAIDVMMKLMINGQEVDGSVTRQGYEKKILVTSLSQETSVPRNQGTGMAAGHRTHQPLIITAEIDKASPLLVKALVNQERIDAVFIFRMPTATGGAKESYRIEIQDARVLAVNHILRDTWNPEKMQYPPLLEVSFGYNQISWTWLPDNKTFSDGLRQPMSGMMGSGSSSHSITEPSPGAPQEEHVFKEGELIKGIEQAPQHPQGWCCAHGKVFSGSPVECENSGGVFFSPDKNEVLKHCPGAKIVPFTGGMQPLQGEGICCVNDGLHEMSAEGCRNEGGVFYKDRAKALRSCGVGSQ